MIVQLPEPTIKGTEDYTGRDIVAYSAEQMLEYAVLAVSAAREQWEKEIVSK